jgi:hypothetical protein
MFSIVQQSCHPVNASEMEKHSKGSLLSSNSCKNHEREEGVGDVVANTISATVI